MDGWREARGTDMIAGASRRVLNQDRGTCHVLFILSIFSIFSL